MDTEHQVRTPRKHASSRRVIAARNLAADARDLLVIDIDRRAFVVGAGHEVAEVGRGTAVVLETEPRSTTFRVGHFLGSGNRGGPGGLPIGTVEHKEDDAFLPTRPPSFASDRHRSDQSTRRLD